MLLSSFRSLAGVGRSLTALASTPLHRNIHASNPGRTGALAIKAGMLAEFDSWGIRHELTVLFLDDCRVVQQKTMANDGYTAMQLGVCDSKVKNVTKPLKVHFAKAGVPPKRHLAEFRCKPEALLPPGTLIGAAHFVPGQKVDVCGTSKGKGFQGGMKRHGFSGGRATHGNSLSHRALGSTGACQDPGKVWKGKKMAGRMGSDRVTMQNLIVFKVDELRQLVYVKGHVPGNAGGFVRIADAVKGPAFPGGPGAAFPFPTHFEGRSSSKESVRYAPAPDVDPLKPTDE